MREDPPTPPCPACGSADTRRSWPRNPWERVKGWLGLYAHRCEECELRFFARRPPPPRGDESARYRLPAPWLILVLGLPLALAGAWLLWGNSEGTPPAREETSAPGPLVKRAMPTPATTSPGPVATSTTTSTTSTTTSTSAAPPPRQRAAAPPAGRRPAGKKKKASRPRRRVRAPAGVYTVQVGAFRSRKRAHRLARRLKRRGLAARVVRVAAPGRPVWFKVWIGAHTSRSQAARAARRVRQTSGLPTLVTRRDQPGAPGRKRASPGGKR